MKIHKWTCKSTDCAKFMPIGFLCKLEIESRMIPYKCPFLDNCEAMWKEIKEGKNAKAKDTKE